MAIEKPVIDDAQIITLYRAGYSQNDIVREYQVSVQRTRSVLQQANFDTRGYRAMNDTMERVIQSLVRRGVYYLDIERVTDISFHAIRLYVTNRWKPSSEERSRFPAEPTVPSSESFPDRDRLLDAYLSGTSFCLLVDEFDLGDENIFRFYLCLTDEVVELHHKAFRKLIRKDLDSGMSVSALARKNCVSRAIIKKYSSN